jgi:NitT/TauT family transport system ATP-binding protein
MQEMSPVISRAASVEANTTTPDISHAVVVRGVTKVFRSSERAIEALQSIDLQICEGEFLCIVGPSGCGKSTLLNILGGLESPTSGFVEYNLPDADKPQRSIVFQEQGVFPWMTVLENTAFGLRARGVAKAERHAVARRVLAEVGLTGFEEAYPRELSGGMRQRVNLARAFANDPQVLLMDEPFANLDEQTKLILQDDLLQIWERHRKTVVFITHSIDEAIRLGDRIVIMTSRPGRIKADIPISLPRPRNVFDLQSNEEYARLRAVVWQSLKDEVLRLR